MTLPPTRKGTSPREERKNILRAQLNSRNRIDGHVFNNLKTKIYPNEGPVLLKGADDEELPNRLAG